jgi:hypothetical protein
MTVAIPKMHTLTLSTKQLEELSDLVAQTLLVEIPASKKTAKAPDEKAFITMSEIFYQSLYSTLINALTESDDE